MARYTGPKVRISRRFNEPIMGDNKALQKKNYAPGMHGKGKKRKQSEYAIQLAEKQKAKRYNWLEWDGHEMVGKFISLPPREDIPENINEQLIVELYSK